MDDTGEADVQPARPSPALGRAAVDHLRSATLADLASGEASAEETRAAGDHLRQCGDCREDLRTLRRLVRTARCGAVEVLPPPPDRVWRAISERLHEGSAPPGDRPPA
ncbi:hypothetical protein [Actinacidiphila sp. bgisy167]|uniref:hypothetical protein n=1 Tax=Actinacidiphila sp. bgisy167 TaxID=3413797 RepID=UPI003D735EC5